jgi:putative flippase GtrA
MIRPALSFRRRGGYGPVMQHFFLRFVPARYQAVAAQFLRFGTVGASGFVVDTACVYATRGWLGLYGAGVLAYLLAATSNWALNRAWTFRERRAHAAHVQWLLFLAVNLAGFVLNRGTYAVLVTFSPLCADNPVLAVAAGTAAGMLVNFQLSRRIAFR